MHDNWTRVPVYTLSIEPLEGKVYTHPYHLGTDLKIAKEIAETLFHNPFLQIRSMALTKDLKLVAVYDGEWIIIDANNSDVTFLPSE